MSTSPFGESNVLSFPVETCWCCFGTGQICSDCNEPGCLAAERCPECNGSGALPVGSSMRENYEPPPEPVSL